MKTLHLILYACFITNLSFGQSPTPFSCSGTDAFGFYVSSVSSTTDGNVLTYSSSKLSSILTSTGATSTLCTAVQIGVSLNALAFNPSDNYLYAVSRYDATQFSGKLYRIGENCQKSVIPVTGGIVSFNTNNKNTIDAAGGNISSGTFDLNNNYYVNTSFTNVASTGFTNKIQKIALTGSIAAVVSTKTLTCSTCTGGEVQVTDIIFDESSGILYGSNKITNKLYSINAATGAMTEIGTTGITGSILGIYKNQSGAVRAIDETGKIYSVNISTGAFTFLNQASLVSSNSDAASGCFGQAHISGYLYVDANGLVDNTVNGIGTLKAGATTMYANLVQNNIIVSSVPFLADGSYQFLGSFSGSYEVQISAHQGIAGNLPPAQDLPATYQFVGDFIGTTPGNDGSANGKLSFSISPAGTSLENINFGIDAKPVANNVSAPSQNNPGGTIKVPVPSLSVSDIEDIVPTTIVILTVPDQATKGILYYNNMVVIAGQIILNFQQSLLQFDPVDGSVVININYEARDAAGLSSNTATVTMEFSAPLSIVLLSFEGRYTNPNVELNWTTGTEVNSDIFIIERSETGRSFETIGFVKTVGFSNVATEYSFEDKAPIANYYYRLKEVDLDGNEFYSPVIFISHKQKAVFDVYPTVFQDGIFIKHNDSENHRTEVSIFSFDGKRVFSTILSDSRQFIDLHHIPLGFYSVTVRNMQNGNAFSKIVIKSKNGE